MLSVWLRTSPLHKWLLDPRLLAFAVREHSRFPFSQRCPIDAEAARTRYLVVLGTLREPPGMKRRMSRKKVGFSGRFFNYRLNQHPNTSQQKLLPVIWLLWNSSDGVKLKLNRKMSKKHCCHSINLFFARIWSQIGWFTTFVWDGRCHGRTHREVTPSFWIKITAVTSKVFVHLENSEDFWRVRVKEYLEDCSSLCTCLIWPQENKTSIIGTTMCI